MNAYLWKFDVPHLHVRDGFFVYFLKCKPMLGRPGVLSVSSLGYDRPTYFICPFGEIGLEYTHTP